MVARHAAIFDMDGVLVDSEPHHHATWYRLCLEEGVTLTVARVAERTLGRPVRESLPTLLGRAIDTVEHERLVRRKAVIYQQVSGGAVLCCVARAGSWCWAGLVARARDPGRGAPALGRRCGARGHDRRHHGDRLGRDLRRIRPRAARFITELLSKPIRYGYMTGSR
jgi:hypothetical protein